MKQIFLIFFCFLLSLGFSLYFVPIMRKAAILWGVVDRPDGNLKRHKQPVPYLGGVAVYLAFLLSVSFLFDYSPEILGLLLAGTVMLLIGLVDDFGVLKPYQKLAGQILATFVLVKAGIYIKIEYFPIWVNIPLTFLWMIGIINAVNIIDISDGLAAGVAYFAGLTFLSIAIINGDFTIAVVTVALTGALVGFLAYNFPPAKIFLGDAGSLFIGLMLGALALIADYSMQNPSAYFAPILILGVPIFDTFFVMAMRAKKGLPIFLGSPDHFAIRLKRHGVSAKKVALIAYLSTISLGAIAIANMFVPALYSVVGFGFVLLLGLLLAFWLHKLDQP